RRYMSQINFMFPIPQHDITWNTCFNYPTEEASSIIKDPEAKYIWDHYVGKNTYYVDFTWFYDNVILRNLPYHGRDALFRCIFTFFVNFPHDNMMTPYKWAVLIDQFGPFEDFADNFKKYCTNYGFLGLI